MVADLPDATELMDLTPGQCRAILRHARVRVDRVGAREAPGVEQPVRLLGPIHGVEFSIPWSKNPRSDLHTIWDCRLVAAMIPLADWLSARGIGEVHYFSVLRRRSSKRKKRLSQHNLGLAIDVLGFVPRRRFSPGDPRNASRWDVEEHYPKGRVQGCPARDFRDQSTDVYAQFVCFATQRGLFHTLLTPDYDRAHRNHLHLDLKAGQTRPADPYVSFSD